MKSEKIALKCFCLSLLFSLVTLLASGQRMSDREEQYYQSQILKYINDYRHSQGLASFVSNAQLDRIAYGHSREMSTGRTAFGHDGFRDRMAASKKFIPGLNGFAENVAYGLQSPREVSQD